MAGRSGWGLKITASKLRGYRPKKWVETGRGGVGRVEVVVGVPLALG